MPAIRDNSQEQITAPAAAEAPAVDYGPLQEWIGFNLRIAQAASFQAFSRRSKDVGLRPGRFATLMLIGQNPGISQTILSRANGRDKSSTAVVLKAQAASPVVLWPLPEERGVVSAARLASPIASAVRFQER